MDLARAPDELTLTVGAYRRNIVLPRLLWPLEVASARFQEGALVVRFAPAESAEP